MGGSCGLRGFPSSFDDALSCTMNATLSQSSGPPVRATDDLAVYPSLPSLRPQRRVAASREACVSGTEPRRRVPHRRGAGRSCGCRLHGRASVRHVKRSGEHQDESVERGRVLGEALAGVERKQGDRATRRLDEDPACDAARGGRDERLDASPVGRAVKFEDTGDPFLRRALSARSAWTKVAV